MMNTIPLITYEILTAALQKRFNNEISKKDCGELALYLLNFFGFYNEVLDNKLENEDRNTFYRLEEVGILKTSRSETKLPCGKTENWKIYKWHLNIEKILEFYKNSKKKTDEGSEEKYNNIYLSDKVWIK